MDWERDFRSDTQMRSIIDQYNDAIEHLPVPSYDRFSVMTLEERNESITTAHLKALSAAAYAMKRLMDLEEMPDRSIEMRVNRMITADRLWQSRIVPFRIMIELLSEQKEHPEQFVDAKKQ